MIVDNKNDGGFNLNLKKLFTAIVCGAITLSALSFSPVVSLDADAASFSDVNNAAVFVKQQTSVTCTLASNVMMLRRAAMMRGDSDWSSVTENACRSTLWCEGVGMYHSYQYKNINVSYQYISGSPRTALINALKQHPEGIVAYDYDYPHAILLTDYTDGVFYCADPARNTPSGRMKVSNALISIDNVDTYWYVASPTVSFNGAKTVDDTSTSVKENWQITSSDGVNMRSGAGISYSRVGGVPYKAVISVTKKKASEGYTWGYTSYGSSNGWVALNYATQVTSSAALENTSTVPKTGLMLGNTLTVKGSATGGSGSYQYMLQVKKSTDVDWTTVRNYASSASMVFNPTSAGQYSLYVKVKDSTGKTDGKKLVVFVGDTALENTSTVPKTGLMLGNALTVKGSATGGAGTYQYTLLTRKIDETDWTTAVDYSTTSKMVFCPSSAGKYILYVKVKDNAGKVVGKQFTVKVGDTPLENNSRMTKETISLGTGVIVKGLASEGTGSYEYTLLVKKSGTTVWKTIRDYDTDPSIELTPQSAGQYDVYVKVRDSAGNIAKKTLTLNVNA